jgi:hypothetical protein
MNRIQLFSGICSLFVIPAFLLLGCPADEGGDAWIKVTDLKQIKGTWEGSDSIDIPEIPLAQLLEMIEDDIPEIAEYKPFLPESLPPAPLDYSVKITVNDTLDLEATVNCKRYLEGTMGPLAAPFIWAYLDTDSVQNLLEDEIMQFVSLYGITYLEIREKTADYKIIAAGGGPMPEDTSIPDIEGLSVFVKESKSKLKIEAEIPKGTRQEIILTRKK